LTPFFVTKRREDGSVPPENVRLEVAAPPLVEVAEGRETREGGEYGRYYSKLERKEHDYYPILAEAASAWRVDVRAMAGLTVEEVHALAAHLCQGVCDVRVLTFPVFSLQFSSADGMRRAKLLMQEMLGDIFVIQETTVERILLFSVLLILYLFFFFFFIIFYLFFILFC
jgi:hypothetical protein